MNTRCVVVIGHVDHGKTALVQSLTRMNTDQLPEEIERGMSITPGFAHKSYKSGIIDFVDAPGHENFIRAMISGATGAHAILVVISITDGVRAQTFEHLQIAGLLGIKNAIIAVTKADLVDPSEHEERLLHIRETLSKISFSIAPLILCSSVTHEGLDLLHSSLEELLKEAHVTPPAPLDSFLPVDRIFSLPGSGTIVTGTLLGNDLALDTDMVLQPLGRDVSIRSLQSRGVERQSVQSGERMAANLRGISAPEIEKGMVLCTKSNATPSSCVDAALILAPELSETLKHMQQLRVMFGTSSEVAQIRLFKIDRTAPRFAQLRFKKPVMCFVGQTAILRRLSPPETIGGAVFLDPQATPTKTSDTCRLQLLRAVKQGEVVNIAKSLCAVGQGVAKLSELARLSRSTADQVRKILNAGFVNLNGDMIAAISDVTTAKAELLNTLTAYHDKHPLRTMAPRSACESKPIAISLREHVVKVLLENNFLRQKDSGLALHDHDPMKRLTQEQKYKINIIEDTYRQAGLSTPQAMPACDEATDLIDLLIDQGSLILLRNIALRQILTFHAETIEKAKATLSLAFPASMSFSTSNARTALNTSRRIVVPLLEHFDSLGFTIRDQDTRSINPSNMVSPSRPAC